MNIAIKNKLNEIRELVKSAKDSEEQEKLSEKDTTFLMKHYDKKIAFYMRQNNTKWAHWPQKAAQIFDKKKPGKNASKKAKNYKKRQNRKERKAKLMAKRALESGSVVVLVDEDIPHGAISVLGKGLGYIPSPKPDDCTTRLDLRLLTNKIVNSSRAKMFSHPSSEQSSYKIPSKLKRTNYAKAEPT